VIPFTGVGLQIGRYLAPLVK